MGLRVRPGNQGAADAFETFNIPEAKKARQVRSNVKLMLTFYFYSRVVVHHEYAPQGQNINKECYLEYLRRLRDAQLWAAGTWQAHHDNAPAHSSQLISWQNTTFLLLTGSLLSLHDALRFLGVPSPENAAEKGPI